MKLQGCRNRKILIILQSRYYSNELNNFVQTLLTKNKNDRPSASQVLKLFGSEIIDKYTND